MSSTTKKWLLKISAALFSVVWVASYLCVVGFFMMLMALSLFWNCDVQDFFNPEELHSMVGQKFDPKSYPYEIPPCKTEWEFYKHNQTAVCTSLNGPYVSLTMNHSSETHLTAHLDDHSLIQSFSVRSPLIEGKKQDLYAAGPDTPIVQTNWMNYAIKRLLYYDDFGCEQLPTIYPNATLLQCRYAAYGFMAVPEELPEGYLHRAYRFITRAKVQTNGYYWAGITTADFQANFDQLGRLATDKTR